MSIKRINMTDLRGYEGREGLILQGCGGDPQEWIDGINDLLTKNEILLDGTKFKNEDCAVFDNNGSTCILYEFTEDTKINMGRLAIIQKNTLSITKSILYLLNGELTEKMPEKKLLIG